MGRNERSYRDAHNTDIPALYLLRVSFIGEALSPSPLPRKRNASCPIKFTYTAMHGVGFQFVREAFAAFSLPDIVPVKEQVRLHWSLVLFHSAFLRVCGWVGGCGWVCGWVGVGGVGVRACLRS